MINFFIGILRVFYYFAGILFVMAGLVSPVSKADNPEISYFEVAVAFLICIGSGIIFFWISNKLGARREFIIKYIMILHCLILFCVGLGVFNLLFGSENFFSDLKRDPLPPTLWYIFFLFISLFPMWFFTRPKVKKQFKARDPKNN